MPKERSERSTAQLKGELAKEFFGLEKAAETVTGFGVGGPSVDLPGSVILTFYWVPPERQDQRHVLFRALMGPHQAKTLAESILKGMTRNPAAPADKPKT